MGAESTYHHLQDIIRILQCHLAGVALPFSRKGKLCLSIHRIRRYAPVPCGMCEARGGQQCHGIRSAHHGDAATHQCHGIYKKQLIVGICTDWRHLQQPCAIYERMVVVSTFGQCHAVGIDGRVLPRGNVISYME